MKTSPGILSIKAVLISMLIFAVYIPFSGWIDLHISSLFYQEGHFSTNPFFDWFFRHGIWPAWITLTAAFIGLALSFLKRRSDWRKPCLYLILVLVIGSGLIIHAALKDHWGRPRPRQVIEFGGCQPFRQFYEPNFHLQPEPSKSFTCGHCSMGFYFFSVAFLGALYQIRSLYWLGMGLAWGLGGLLSLARIAQGGHFFSDVLATCLIMWLTAWCLAYFMFMYNGRNHERIDTKAK